jgi:hypothetical protein
MFEPDQGISNYRTIANASALFILHHGPFKVLLIDE